MRSKAEGWGWRAWVTGALFGSWVVCAVAAEPPGELLVQFMPDSTESARERALVGVQARVLQTLGPDLQRVALAPGLSTQAAARQLRRQPGVSYAEPQAGDGPPVSLDDRR